jgi:hypothetical protein
MGDDKNSSPRDEFDYAPVMNSIGFTLKKENTKPGTSRSR